MIAAPFVIETKRLRLLAATPASARAELEGPAALARFLDAAVEDDWPPEYYDASAMEYSLRHLEADPVNVTWMTYYFLLRGEAGDTLIGIGGYKGPPANGVVEIGYSVTQRHRRQGYASEAAGGLIDRAFATPGVERVIAETLPELAGSQGVLRRNGFELTGEGSEPGVIRFERRR